MNYLGHARFSGTDADLLAGNMMADYIKGSTALNRLPRRIQQGIQLHREIDAFTDRHPAMLRATLPFRETYRRYSGAIADTLFDHFLANDARYFPSKNALHEFAQQTYLKLESRQEWFPENFLRVSQAMAAQNWLYHYHTLGGVQKSLGGLQRRAKYLPEVDTAYQIFIGHYHLLAQCWQELGDGVAAMVEKRLTERL